MASVPESLRKNIEAYLHLPQHVTLGDVKAIIEAIDHISADGKEALYLRLDTWSSAIICGILKRSEDCLAYQRGLCLLTVRSAGSELRPGQLNLFRNHYTRTPCLRKVNELCAPRRSWHWEVYFCPRCFEASQIARNPNTREDGYVSLFSLRPKVLIDCQVGSLMLELVRDCEENKVRLCQDAETNWCVYVSDIPMATLER